MSRMTHAVSIWAGLMLSTSVALAGPTLSLSSPDNLANLKVGQVVTIDVNLQGLPAGTDFIFNLNSSVLFPSTRFQAVPDPGNSSGLTSGIGSGFAFNFASQATGFYAFSSLVAGDAIGISGPPAPAIGQDGLFYSFNLKAIAAGSGSIMFDPSLLANEYAANDTGFSYAPLPTGAPLSFAISSVPEPSSLLLGILGAAGVAGLIRIKAKVLG